MKRTYLRNKFIDPKTDADRMAYNKQRNYCVSLTQKKKKIYYRNLKISDVADVKTFFSEKVNLETNILLVEKENDLSEPEVFSEVAKVISDDIEITFNKCFVNIVLSLKILPKEDYERCRE